MLSDRRKATAILLAVVAALEASASQGQGRDGADLRRRVGALAASAGGRIEAGDYGADLRACFAAATEAGATFEGMNRVRLASRAFTDAPGVVRRIAQTATRYALVEMSRILAATAFVSRGEAEIVLARINVAFTEAEDAAADQRDATVYRALVSLHAAVARDLTQRSRLLPRRVAYALPGPLPALPLANRLYGEASRTADLIRENRVVHPLFMPGSGQALAL